MRVDYPVAVDNDFAIWRAFDNQYWPALYVIDAQGRVRHHHFGEGEYEKSERIIQQLLTEAGNTASALSSSRSMPAAPRRRPIGATSSPRRTTSATTAPRTSRRPAARCGTGRASMRRPARLKLNQWALSGDWTVDNGRGRLNKPNGRIVYRFHARDLHLVMGPAARGSPCASACSSTDSRRAPRTGRRRRPGQRHGHRTAAVSAGPPAEAHRRRKVRDRVSRSGRGSVRVHVRLILAQRACHDPRETRLHASPGWGTVRHDRVRRELRGRREGDFRPANVCRDAGDERRGGQRPCSRGRRESRPSSFASRCLGAPSP